jgi:hypothetical protein
MTRSGSHASSGTASYHFLPTTARYAERPDVLETPELAVRMRSAGGRGNRLTDSLGWRHDGVLAETPRVPAAANTPQTG